MAKRKMVMKMVHSDDDKKKTEHSDNVVPFKRPPKKPPAPNLDVEWFYDEAEFFSEWMDEFDW